jgi:hypothetical protein
VAENLVESGEGSIYRRASDGLWVASLTYADDSGKRRQRVVASGKRRGVVAEKLEEARRRLKVDEPVKDARLTVAMFVEDWIRKALPAPGRKPTTVENYSSLPAPVADMLKRHRAAQAAERLAALVWAPWADHPDLVFPTLIGTPTDPRNALRAFAGIADRAGLVGAGLHTLRHSAASALIASGAHLKVVQELLGHSSYGITADIYSHVAMEQQRAAERLSEVFPW